MGDTARHPDIPMTLTAFLIVSLIALTVSAPLLYALHRRAYFPAQVWLACYTAGGLVFLILPSEARVALWLLLGGIDIWVWKAVDSDPSGNSAV